MNLFALRLAWREGRAGLRRMGVYLASITLGVAVLVAVHSFRGDVVRAVQEEARTLLGGDLRLESQAPFPPGVEAMLDSLRSEGVEVTRAVQLLTMVGAPRTGATRLMQVRGVDPGYPLFGRVHSDPEGAWEALPRGGAALADPAALPALGIVPGDTLQVGGLRLPLLGTVDGLPADVGFQTAVGPRVYLALDDLRGGGLLGFGSLARHQALLALPSGDPEALRDAHRERLREAGISTLTAREQAESLSDALEILSRLLGLVGLVALLLGGIGVASAIHVFVRERLTSVAVLRCLGARQAAVFRAYLLQAAGLGLVGSGAGALAGIGFQALLPLLLRDFLPVAVRTTPDLAAVGAGLVVGVWVSLAFALLPLLGIRDVPPLRALRQDVEGGRRGTDPMRWATLVGVAASLVALSVWQAPEPRVGLVFAAALAGVIGVLRLLAFLLVRMTRSALPRGAPYPLRQGVSNLHRPRNQTVTVVLALGFGTFLVATVGLVERNLAERFRLEVEAGAPTAVLFDIQPGQREGIQGLLRDAGAPEAHLTPIVPGRIVAIGDRRVDEIVGDTTGTRVPRWALRRIYRNTWQEELRTVDEVTAGQWWSGDAGNPPDGIPRISLETELASELGVVVGDRITWDFQGVEVETRVASLRRVDWARLETNFFVVFEPGVLEEAPHTLVALARVPEGTGTVILQRGLLEGFPNVSLVDLGELRATLERILGTVSRAIRILALLTVGGGALVLAGSLATSRAQRIREGALLRTLGARRGPLVGIFLTEYATLGGLAALVGVGLGVAASRLVVTRVFELPWILPAVPAILLPLGVVALALLLGALNSRGLLSRPPLPVLREVGE